MGRSGEWEQIRLRDCHFPQIVTSDKPHAIREQLTVFFLVEPPKNDSKNGVFNAMELALHRHIPEQLVPLNRGVPRVEMALRGSPRKSNEQGAVGVPTSHAPGTKIRIICDP
jgi:hypothetical protein